MKRRTFLKGMASATAIAAVAPTTFVGAAKAGITPVPLITHGRHIIVTRQGRPHWYDTHRKRFLSPLAAVKGRTAPNFMSRYTGNVLR